MFKKFWKYLHRNNLSWQIKHGYAPRGRTGKGGKMGGHKMTFNQKKPLWFRIGNALRKLFNFPLAGETRLVAKHIRNGEEIGRRVVYNRKVTTAFVNFLVDNLQAETSEWGDFKYHDSGTDNTAENNADTTLGTPTGVARATGTQVDGDFTYEYRSVGTITYDGTYAVVEHGLFSQSTGGTLMDRTVFTAINVENNDQIEFTFDILFSAEA